MSKKVCDEDKKYIIVFECLVREQINYIDTP